MSACAITCVEIKGPPGATQKSLELVDQSVMMKDDGGLARGFHGVGDGTFC